MERPGPGYEEVIVTTTDHVPGYKVRSVLGTVSGFTFHQSRSCIHGYREDKERAMDSVGKALKEMKLNAWKMGANAVIGARITVIPACEGSGGTVIWYGTAVIIEPLE